MNKAENSEPKNADKKSPKETEETVSKEPNDVSLETAPKEPIDASSEKPGNEPSEKAGNESPKETENKSFEEAGANPSENHNSKSENPKLQSFLTGPQAAPVLNQPRPQQTQNPNSTQAPASGSAPARAKKQSSEKSMTVAALVIGLFALVSSIVSIGLFVSLYSRNGGTVTLYDSGSDGNSANFTEGSIAEVANKVSDSVVSIVTETRTSSWYGTYSSSAAGTGFIVTHDGYIVTNKHVVEDARSVSVILSDGTEYDNVEVVGTDPLNDVAVIKVSGVSGLTPATLGDSKTIHVGEQVITIGNALGAYQNTVAYGIISGTGRSLTASDSTGSTYESLTDMIQTDAAINGGNSGGPLVNAAGEVIGINTAYASDGNNIGFAIPISSIKGLLRDVEKTGKVQRAVLGVRYVSLTPSIAKEYEVDITAGALITSSNGSSAVISGGAGEQAGLRENDIITAINGVKIGSAGSLSTLVGEYSVGDTVQLTVHRGDQDYTTNATLTAYTN